MLGFGFSNVKVHNTARYHGLREAGGFANSKWLVY